MNHRNIAAAVILLAQGLPRLARADDAEGAAPKTTTVPFNIGLVPYVDVDSHLRRPKNNASIDGVVGSAWGLEGVAVSGGLGFVWGEARGVQVAGAGGYVGGDFSGVQIGGATALTRGRVTGVQLAGAVDAASEVEGVQVSVVNVGRKVRGAQIGIVNVADEVDAPIGLVNVVRKSARHEIELATSSTAAFSFGAKLGTKYVYSILGLGLQSGAAGAAYWMPMVGIGGSIPIRARGFVNIEALVSAVNKGEEFDTKTFLAQLRVAGGYHVVDGVAFFVGPTLSLLQSSSGKRLSDVSYIPTLTTYDARRPTDVGLGFTAGVQLL